MTYQVKSSETEEQKIVIRWARVMQSRLPALGNLYHVPNEAKRSRQTAAVLKSMGLSAGVPDLILDYPMGAYHGCRIELKHGANKPSKHQIDWLNRLQDAGYFVAVCYESDAAIRVLEKYLTLQAGEEMRFDTRRSEQYGVPVF